MNRFPLGGGALNGSTSSRPVAVASATCAVTADLAAKRHSTACTCVSATVTALAVAMRFCTAIAPARATCVAYSAGNVTAAADCLGEATASLSPRVTRYLAALATGVVSVQAKAKHKQRAYALLPTTATHVALAHHAYSCAGALSAVGAVTAIGTRRRNAVGAGVAIVSATATARQKHQAASAAVASGGLSGTATYRHRAAANVAQGIATVTAAPKRPGIPITSIVGARGASFCTATAQRQLQATGHSQAGGSASGIPQRQAMGVAALSGRAVASGTARFRYQLSSTVNSIATVQCVARRTMRLNASAATAGAGVVASLRGLKDYYSPPDCVRYIRAPETRRFSRRADNLEFERRCA